MTVFLAGLNPYVINNINSCVCNFLIQNHIGSLNWAYRVELRDKKVTYKNATGTLVNAHTVKVKDFPSYGNIFFSSHYLIVTRFIVL